MEQQINLYQPIMGAEKRLFSAVTVLGALGLMMLLLGGLSSYGAWRTTRAERVIAALERGQGATLELTARAGATLRPRQTLAELDAEARELTAQVEARDRALRLVREGSGHDAGFAARLEALARPALAGLWLQNIRLRSSRDGVALRGGTTDPTLVPGYLSSLSSEPALEGAHFDRLSIRQAGPHAAPAAQLFELDAPGLDFGPAEKSP